MKPLGDLETLIMQLAWANPGSTVREIFDRMEGKQKRAYTTVMTTMDRLHRKDLLTRTKDGLAWRYQPTMSQADFEHALADELATEILQVHGEVGLAAFVDAASTDPAMLDRLAALIAQRKAEK